MAVKIRLKRVGKRGQPSYRVVVMDEQSPRDSRVVEDLGFYNPLQEEVQIDKVQALEWLKRGAQPTQTTRHLLSKQGLMAELHKIRKGSAPAAS
ncbi:30S ribosomal protein S16 [Candidatus Acetothermia bacterium]|nr:30S ribosomal protein S16 [Candidatus Acetothermia bacterium]MBI3459749.1 30S ribosomal protein S16 [Candidatus Acetothermia bacterium]MBI3661162.1 30S ribosomal protein S16 [Candidatus Acetothermia bacterium]